MSYPISIQLYSLRSVIDAKDPVPVLKRLAQIGYRYVEPCNLFGRSPAEFRRLCGDLGLGISSSHVPWASVETLDTDIETMKELGLNTLVTGYGKAQFAHVEAIVHTAEKVNRMCAVLNRLGISLCLHNHDHEFNLLPNGQLAYDFFLSMCPSLKLEIDVYWAANFAANDPVATVKKHAQRTPLLHIKDGMLDRKTHALMTPVGSGKIDISACVKAADPAILKYLIVEADNSETDMLVLAEKSYRYLVEQGLGN